jgi:hypothetical protein
MVTSDPDTGLAVWVLPGTPTEQRLAAAGWVFEPGPPRVLPAGARQDVLAVAAGPVEVRSGGAAVVDVAVTHPPGGEPWPALLTFGGPATVRLAVRWFGSARLPTTCPGPIAGAPAVPARSPTIGGPAPVACPNVELPRVVLPGDTVTIPVPLAARSSEGAALPPGTYTVRLGVYQEGVGGFADRGTTEVTVRVTG